MIFDIDNFKAVNDQFGHAAGDRVIQFVAQQAQISLTDNQSLARIGGEEFAILAFFSSSMKAAQYAQYLVDRIAKNSVGNFPEIGMVTVSLGVAYYPNSLEHYELSLADQALYQAKHNGKNQVSTLVYSG